MSFQLWLAFVAASTALLLIPGPTVLLVLTYAVSRGRRIALTTALGVALGDFIAMSASLAGLGALVLTSAQLFVVIKWVGAAYLIWLGWNLFRSAASNTASVPDSDEKAAPPDKSSYGIFWHAAVVTALNPKGIVFFIAFVPQFVTPGSPILPQFVVLLATFITLAAVPLIVASPFIAFSYYVNRKIGQIHRRFLRNRPVWNMVRPTRLDANVICACCCERGPRCRRNRFSGFMTNTFCATASARVTTAQPTPIYVASGHRCR